MSRQTAFPGVIIEEIEATAGSGGRTLDFPEGLPENIPTDRIESFTNEIRFFGSDLVGDSKLTYRLQVAGVSKSAAHLKGRTFVRAKNPFEPQIIEVRNVDKLKDMGVMELRNAYSVEVVVTK